MSTLNSEGLFGRAVSFVGQKNVHSSEADSEGRVFANDADSKQCVHKLFFLFFFVSYSI